MGDGEKWRWGEMAKGRNGEGRNGDWAIGRLDDGMPGEVAMGCYGDWEPRSWAHEKVVELAL
jgi:hypothetical protein